MWRRKKSKRNQDIWYFKINECTERDENERQEEKVECKMNYSHNFFSFHFFFFFQLFFNVRWSFHTIDIIYCFTKSLCHHLLSIYMSWTTTSALWTFSHFTRPIILSRTTIFFCSIFFNSIASNHLNYTFNMIYLQLIVREVTQFYALILKPCAFIHFYYVCNKFSQRNENANMMFLWNTKNVWEIRFWSESWLSLRRLSF